MWSSSTANAVNFDVNGREYFSKCFTFYRSTRKVLKNKRGIYSVIGRRCIMNRESLKIPKRNVVLEDFHLYSIFERECHFSIGEIGKISFLRGFA